MSPATSEELLVGAIALVLVPLIGRRILRGVRTGRLPLYRTSILREDDRVKFGALLGLHALSLLLVAIIAADLLLNLDLKERL
jgi:hypothetical protein